ncbi:hypothetical protein ES705_26589 [subsurface metagenome]
MTKIKSLKKEDKIEELGNKICKYVEYIADGKKGRALELAALADILFSIKGIFRRYEKRITELEKFKFNVLGYYEINETGGVNNIKIGGTDPD